MDLEELLPMFEEIIGDPYQDYEQEWQMLKDFLLENPDADEADVREYLELLADTKDQTDEDTEDEDAAKALRLEQAIKAAKTLLKKK
jgi:outer membrane protein assembly factor BamD (BamD/ComL family)